MLKIAETLAEKLDDKPEAILAYRALHEEFGPERVVLTSLENLYESTERYDDLAERSTSISTFSDDPALRVEVLARLGEVRRVHQKNWQGALEAFRQALLLNPSHPSSRAGIEKLLEIPEARREAAETLHPLYEDDRDHESLLRVLEIEAEAAETPKRGSISSSRPPKWQRPNDATRVAHSGTPCAAFASQPQSPTSPRGSSEPNAWRLPPAGTPSSSRSSARW